MSKAEFVRDTNRAAHPPYSFSNVIVYRCQQCRREFEVGTGWHNCFYCCQHCADVFNACPACGDCRCQNTDESMDDDDCPLHSPRSRHAEHPEWGEYGESV